MIFRKCIGGVSSVGAKTVINQAISDNVYYCIGVVPRSQPLKVHYLLMQERENTFLYYFFFAGLQEKSSHFSLS
jgi:hypothetical protein